MKPLLLSLVLLAASTQAGAAPAAAFPQTFVSIPDYRVAYTRKGRGPTLVLLHGGGVWSYSWRRNLDDLARNHDVVAFDMIGHGNTRRTAPGRPAYDLAQTTRFIDRTLTTLNIRKASLVGNSWGGGWALAYAQAHPERVNRLVLIGSSGTPIKERPEWEIMRWPLVGELMMRMAKRGDIASGLREAVLDPRTVTEADVDAAWAPMARPEVKAAQVGFMRGLDWRETARLAPQTRTPTLLLHGDHDRYVPYSANRTLCRALPQAKLERVEQAGHVAHEDQPARVDAAIIAFVDSTAPVEKRC